MPDTAIYKQISLMEALAERQRRWLKWVLRESPYKTGNMLANACGIKAASTINRFLRGNSKGALSAKTVDKIVTKLGKRFEMANLPHSIGEAVNLPSMNVIESEGSAAIGGEELRPDQLVLLNYYETMDAGAKAELIQDAADLAKRRKDKTGSSPGGRLA